PRRGRAVPRRVRGRRSGACSPVGRVAPRHVGGGHRARDAARHRSAAGHRDCDGAGRAPDHACPGRRRGGAAGPPLGPAPGAPPGSAPLMVVERSTVGLRVDVDTRRGLDEGVPRLLALFRRLGIRASFFVTMGPDHSGRAIRRALRPSFLAKMWRTNPFKLYGLRTLLSGTLAPARLVGAGAPAML